MIDHDTSQLVKTPYFIVLFFPASNLVYQLLSAVYVFDGKPPTMKSGELEKRKEKREEAENALAKAKEEGNMEEVDKQVKTLKLNVS